MQNVEIRNAIMDFSEDLKASICMEDRREAVGYLAEKIGAKSANKVAEVFGLVDTYYHAEKVGA